MPRIRSRRQKWKNYTLEILEARQLLSGIFTYDLRLAPAQLGDSADLHSVDLSQPHLSTYTMQLWAQIVGDTNLSNDTFNAGYASIASTQVNGLGALSEGGITDGEVNGNLFNLFASNGSSANITSDGVDDWGSANVNDVTNWVFWANADSHNINGNSELGYLDGTRVTGQSEPIASNSANGWEVLVATFTVNVSSVAVQDRNTRSTVFNVDLPQNQLIENVPVVVAHIDGSSSPTNTTLIGVGVAFNLPATPNRTVDTLSKSLYANANVPFSAGDFSGAFWDGSFGGSLAGVKITSLPAHGTLTLDGGAVTPDETIAADQLADLLYTPQANFVGTDAFNWNGTDGSGFADADAAVNLTISADPPPVITDVVVNPGAALPYKYTFTAADFSSQFSDLVPGDTMASITITALPAAGVLTLSGTPVTLSEQIPAASLSALSYTPSVSFGGLDTFAWIATDATGITSNTAHVTLAANGPTISPISLQTPYGTPLAFSASLFGNAYSDGARNQSLATVTVLSLPVNGTLTLNGSPVSAGAQINAADLSGLRYTPRNVLVRVDGFSWAAFDGYAFSFHPASVRIQVTGFTPIPVPAAPPASLITPPPATAQQSGPTMPAGATPGIAITFSPEALHGTTLPAPLAVSPTAPQIVAGDNFTRLSTATVYGPAYETPQRSPHRRAMHNPVTRRFSMSPRPPESTLRFSHRA